jgi:hypothetical protein
VFPGAAAAYPVRGKTADEEEIAMALDYDEFMAEVQCDAELR